MSQDSCTITGPLGKVLHISSVFGIAPINLTRKPRGYVGTVSRGRPLGKYIAMPLLGISITLYYIIKFLPQLTGANIETSTSIKQIENIVHESLSAFITGIVIFNGSIRVKQTIKYLNQIEEVNNKLERNTGDYNNSQKLFVSCFLVVSGCKTVRNSWVIYHAVWTAKADIFLSGLQLILFLATVLIEMQFVFKVCLLNETIRGLNKKLYDLLFKYDVFGSVMMYSTADYLEARNYCRIYLTIRHIIYKLNKQEGLISMLLLTTYLIKIFYFVHNLTAQFNFEIPITSVIFNIGIVLIWFITIVLPLFLHVESCHQTSQEVQKVHNLLSHLMSTSMQRQLSNDFSIFSQHYLQHSPVFCPLGMVTLTRPLYLKIVGSILTYVSLISEFHLGDQEMFLQI